MNNDDYNNNGNNAPLRNMVKSSITVKGQVVPVLN
jgi:hypothetical protein